ncbi:MAG: threonine synthase [Chloroflexi bacterium]|nr:threonine synthase [Chloroflexota bacterium]MYB16615.1 threonine synthase [Chloroflexota bacterium]
METGSLLSHLVCCECGRQGEADRVQTVCPDCGGSWLAEYALEDSGLDRTEISRRPRGMWRYREVLPVRREANIVDLGEGSTPTLRLRRIAGELGLKELWLKDEGSNPTGTFKARGAAAAYSRARELGIRDIAMGTAGNAGSALAAYAAPAGIAAHVAMPRFTPDPIKAECRAYGAEVVEVDGPISVAGKLMSERAAANGWFEGSTLKEPYRIEGKKTMGYELAEFFGWQMPDVVLYPTGGGVGLIGIWKAALEMARLGWLTGRKMPRLVAVQASGCDPIVTAYEAGHSTAQAPESPYTLAAGLLVPLPYGHRLVLRIIKETGGVAISVEDSELAGAVREMAEREGLLLCPEAAALLPALKSLLDSGAIDADERVVLLSTGNGLKYPHVFNGA